MSMPGMSGFGVFRLPHELLLCMFEYLDATALVQFVQTCRASKRSLEEDDGFWSILYVKRFDDIEELAPVGSCWRERYNFRHRIIQQVPRHLSALSRAEPSAVEFFQQHARSLYFYLADLRCPPHCDDDDDCSSRDYVYANEKSRLALFHARWLVQETVIARDWLSLTLLITRFPEPGASLQSISQLFTTRHSSQPKLPAVFNPFPSFLAAYVSVLDRASLCVARTARPHLRLRDLRCELDDLALTVRSNLQQLLADPAVRSILKLPDTPTASLFAVRVKALCHVLHHELGFQGAEAYYCADNSFIDQVLRRKVGIPISLGALYMTIAARLGLYFEGVNSPGHFLLRVDNTNNPESLFLRQPSSAQLEQEGTMLANEYALATADAPPEVLYIDAFNGVTVSEVTAFNFFSSDFASMQSALFQPCELFVMFLRCYLNLQNLYNGDGCMGEVAVCASSMTALLLARGVDSAQTRDARSFESTMQPDTEAKEADTSAESDCDPFDSLLPSTSALAAHFQGFRMRFSQGDLPALLRAFGRFAEERLAPRNRY